jgi:ubiquitin carboxyl-terminal hydrolase 4/11/15
MLDAPAAHDTPAQPALQYAPSASGKSLGMPQPAAAPVTTLADCLAKFKETEQLGENDKWYCADCKAHVCAYKTMGLWRLPRVLILHLKRFKGGNAGAGFFGGYGGYGGGYGYGSRAAGKISTAVKFPLRGLDLAPYLCAGAPAPDGAAAGAGAAAAGAGGSTLYDLYAVSLHSGNVGGGHYTAKCLHRSGQWVDFNDSHASASAPVSELDRDAYLLFYRRRGAGGDAAAEAAADAAAAAAAATDDAEMLDDDED